MKKTRFLVDMDGVVADFVDSLLTKIYNKHPHLHEEMPVHKLKMDGFYTHQWFENKITANQVYPLYQTKHFFEDLLPITGCIEMIEYLRSKNVDVVFCTTPIIYGDELYSFMEKAHWLRKHFGQWSLGKLTLTSDKTTVNGKIIIDDKPQIHGDDTPTWTHILFDQPWNQNSNAIRMKGGWTKENMDWLLEEYRK